MNNDPEGTCEGDRSKCILVLRYHLISTCAYRYLSVNRVHSSFPTESAISSVGALKHAEPIAAFVGSWFDPENAGRAVGVTGAKSQLVLESSEVI